MKRAAACIVLLVTAVTAGAFDLRAGPSVLVPRNATVSDDLAAAGGDVSVYGKVNGSVLAAGRDLTISGAVSGFIGAAGNTVNLSGAQGVVTAAGRHVAARSLSARNLALAGTRVEVDDLSRVARDVVAAGTSVTVRGTIGRDLRMAGSDLAVGARVSGNVYASGTNVSVLPGGVIRGDLVYESPNRAKIAGGATVLGRLIHRPARRAYSAPGRLVSGIFGFFMMLLFGVVFVALFPRWSERSVGHVVESPGWSVLWGLVGLIVTPIAAAIALVTIVGIPIGLASLAAYLVSLMLAVVVSGVALGGLVLRGRAVVWWRLALGLLIIFLLGAIPFVGGLIWLAVVLFGLGALALSIVRRQEPGVETERSRPVAPA